MPAKYVLVGDDHAEVRIGLKTLYNPVNAARTSKHPVNECAAPCVAVLIISEGVSYEVRAALCMQLAHKVIPKKDAGLQQYDKRSDISTAVLKIENISLRKSLPDRCPHMVRDASHKADVKVEWAQYMSNCFSHFGPKIGVEKVKHDSDVAGGLNLTKLGEVGNRYAETHRPTFWGRGTPFCRATREVMRQRFQPRRHYIGVLRAIPRRIEKRVRTPPF
jgi:hypothetical protein